ncbi:hypothetical protein MKW98_015760, partial [Papaver atlanticum]
DQSFVTPTAPQFYFSGSFLICNQFFPRKIMHPPLTLHRHPMCTEIIEEFQKCHIEHPYAKFFGECTDLKIKLDRCFRQEKAVKRKTNFEESKKLKERHYCIAGNYWSRLAKKKALPPFRRGSVNLYFSSSSSDYPLPIAQKGVGSTAPDPSEFQALDDDVVVPLGKPKKPNKLVK